MDHFEKIEESLKELCEECKDYKTNRCIKSKCYIGFASNAIKAAKVNDEKVIKDGVKLIPKEDMKYYEENAVAKSIANVCRLCRECEEKHDENCVISLARRSLETTCLQERVVYPGNVLMYLLNVSKQNDDFANKIKNHYMQLKQ